MTKFVFLASFLIPMVSLAQQIRVEKLKGNKAVIEFTGNLIPGKTYSIDGTSASHSENSAHGKRQYVLGGSLGFSSSAYTSPSINATLKHSDMNLSTRFGWNYESFEIGPMFGYKNVDSDYADQHFSSFSGGAFADYNMTPNRPGETMIFGVTGEAVFGSITPKTGNSGSTMEFFVGGFFKWFGLTDSTALRADLGYDYLKTTADASSNTLQGFVLRGGIATYF